MEVLEKMTDRNLTFYIENKDLYKLKCISRDKNMSFQDFINSILINKINENNGGEIWVK